MAGLDDQVTNCAAFVLHDKVSDVANHSLAGLDVVAAYSLCASQMRTVGIVGVAIPACFLTLSFLAYSICLFSELASCIFDAIAWTLLTIRSCVNIPPT
jgi:hypothetical protein